MRNVIRSGATGGLSAGLCAALAACSLTKAPGVEVSDVSLGNVTDEGYELQFELTLSNPNLEPLELHETEYRLSVGGAPVYDGRWSAEASVKAEGAKTITIPAVVPFDRAGEDTVPDRIDYSINGTMWYMTTDRIAEILFDANIRRPSVGYGTSGELTFR